jgi:NhaP-type Na+/H+ or K+/H+ antiporter
MHDLPKLFTTIGLLVLLTGFFSVTIEKSKFLSRPMLFFGFGLLLGEYGFGVFQPLKWGTQPHKILELFTELTLAISLMAVALRLPSGYFRKHKKAIFLLLAIGMPSMWLTSTVIIKNILGFPWSLAFLLAAIITPTDPVLATSIVQGKVAKECIPERIRNLSSAESGINDGLALPFVFLPFLIMVQGHDTAYSEWISHVIIRETFGAIALGILLGKLTGFLLEQAEKNNYIEKTSTLSTTLALTLLMLGLSKVIGVNSVLAVFIAGLAFDNNVSNEEQSKDEKVQEAFNHFFTSPIFFLMALFVPIEEWIKIGPQGLILVLAILLLRRLPGVMIYGRFIPELKCLKESSFVGWFGPIGAAALYYSLKVKGRSEMEMVWVITTYIIAGSILVHGLSATPLARWLKNSDEV